MGEADRDIRCVVLPAALVEALEQSGFGKSELKCSEVALSLSVCVNPNRFGDSDATRSDPFRDLAQAVLSIRQSALQVGLDLPVVVVLDLRMSDENATNYSSFRRTFDRWAGDQDWHRGDFALYLCPPLDPAGDGCAEWTGPKNRLEMVQHLLGQGTEEWGLVQRKGQTEVGIAGQLEEWAGRHGHDRSDLHGDLLHSAAAALRAFDQARSKDRAEAARKAAAEEAQEAIDRWAARHLKVIAEEASAAEEES